MWSPVTRLMQSYFTLENHNNKGIGHLRIVDLTELLKQVFQLLLGHVVGYVPYKQGIVYVGLLLFYCLWLLSVFASRLIFDIAPLLA